MKPAFRRKTGNHDIHAVLLDVRGTVLDKKDDIPLSKELAALINGLLKKNIRVAFISACSIATLTDLVLKELTGSETVNQERLTNLVCYINNSSGAYTYNEEGHLVRLNNYPFVTFSDSDIKAIKQSIAETNKKLKLTDVRVKQKAGQFNYYCGGSFEKRLEVAETLKNSLASKNKNHVFTLVPTSKDTIDISVNNKSRGASDFVDRFGLKQENIIFISDSLQETGADYCICLDFPEILSVPVKDENETCRVLTDFFANTPDKK